MIMTPATEDADNNVGSIMEPPTWSSNTTSTFNGQVLTFEGALGYDNLELFRDTHISLERGSIYGLVAPNGSGKSSFARALPLLPEFPEPSDFRTEYLAADTEAFLRDTPAVSDKNDGTVSSISARTYCLTRVQNRVLEMEEGIDRLEIELENASTDSSVLEDISNRLGELYDSKEDLELGADFEANQMFKALQFGNYENVPPSQLSCGWRYKCQLIAALLTRPDCFIVDEPSFLDTEATAWFVSKIHDLAKSKSAMVVLISHKEALMEEVCDRILYLNPASKTLTVYNCSFREFQQAHADRVSHAKKTKERADGTYQDATKSLTSLRQQLNKREHNCQAQRLKMFTDKRWVKGKCKEAKQKADHSAAAKVKRLSKVVTEAAEREADLRETHAPPLELEGTVGDSKKPLVELCDVNFRYEGSRDMLLEYVDVQITGTDKVLVQGPNGQGKTTLAKILLGQLDPTSGDARKHVNFAAHFQQDALADLVYRHGQDTAVDFLVSKDRDTIALLDARTHLGRFGLKGNVCLRPIRTLSAGQRVRLWLAREFLGKRKPSLLVLDETTENLDKETTDSLLASLEHFSAAILAISHDDYFCEKFPATQVWEVGHRRVHVKFQKEQ